MPICTTSLEKAKSHVPNLRLVSDKLVRGGQPHADGLKALKAAGVTTIINLCAAESKVAGFSTGLHCGEGEAVERERQLSEVLGLQFISLPLNVFAVPDQGVIKQFIDAVTGSEQPVFVHCLYGRDRTGLMVSLYRVLCQGWTADDAHKEMLACGFDFNRTNLSNVLFSVAQRGTSS